MTLTSLFNHEIETAGEANVAQNPEIRAFLDSVLLTAETSLRLSDADRATLRDLVGPPDLKATAAEMADRLDKMAPYLPSIKDRVAFPIAEPVLRVHLQGVSATAEAGNITPTVSV